jgi:hypothetical protein
LKASRLRGVREEYGSPVPMNTTSHSHDAVSSSVAEMQQEKEGVVRRK